MLLVPSCVRKVIESLNADDWTKPTACTDWNVHDIVAHQAGGYVSGTNYKEMIRLIRLYTSKVRPGRLPEDAVNEFQVCEQFFGQPLFPNQTKARRRCPIHTDLKPATLLTENSYFNPNL
jgi:hypothetical protein